MMKKRGISFATLALLMACVGAVGTRPVSADGQPATMNCTQAEAMLEKAVTSKIPALMTGDVDRDFAALMMAHEKVGQRINQIEAKCGRDPKMQSIAAKNAADTQERMDEFRNLGTSQ